MNKNQMLNQIKKGFQKASDFIEEEKIQNHIQNVKQSISKIINHVSIKNSKNFLVDLFESEEAKNLKQSIKNIFKKEK